MKVNFKAKNKVYNIEVDPKITIQDFKQMIEKDHAYIGLKAEGMKMIHAGRIMKDAETLESNGIVENTTICALGNKVRKEEKEPQSINQTQELVQQQYQQPMQPQGNGVFNMGNESFKNLMSQQFDMILANPDLFDQYLGPMFANLDPATRENRKNQMLEQMRMLKDNPQMMEGILDQMKSMDPNAMQQMMNQSNPGGMPNLGQQPFPNSYMQAPQASPTVPCSHGFYPYGYVIQPQMMYQPQQNMYQAPMSNASPKLDPNTNYEELYKEQLKQLSEMGFDNKEESLKALKITNGNVELAVNVLCEWSQQANK